MIHLSEFSFFEQFKCFPKPCSRAFGNECCEEKGVSQLTVHFCVLYSPNFRGIDFFIFDLSQREKTSEEIKQNREEFHLKHKINYSRQYQHFLRCLTNNELD